MNVSELLLALDERGVDRAVYSLDARPETYVIQPRRSGVVGTPDYWVTCYSEHGVETALERFACEEAACAHFLAWIGADPGVRIGSAAQ